jgi:PleD family two-component response regulator
MRKTVTRGDEIYSSDVFQILYEYEVSRSKRYPSPLTLLKIEMAPSALNDELLGTASTIFASALNAHLRSVDIPSKTGTSYSVVLPASDEHGARAVCVRLLSVFKNKFDVSNGAIAFSLQIGATSHNGGSTITGESILQKADEALKQSKLKGSNTYIVLS